MNRINHENISVRPIRTRAEWTRLIRLYRHSFPPSERKPYIILLSYWRKKKTDIWYAEETTPSRPRFLGFAATLNGEKDILLDYLAVSNDARGKGVGSVILKKLLSAYSDKGFFTEIESVFEKDAQDIDSRIRRRRFYLGNGLMPLHVLADVFGVQMELLGVNTKMDFESYNAFYKNNYSAFAARHVKPVKEHSHSSFERR